MDLDAVRTFVAAADAGRRECAAAMVQRILAAAGLSEAERASIGANQVPSHKDVPR